MTGSLAERLVGLAVLAALPWPLYAAVASRPYWQVFPRVARVLAVLLLGYGVFLATLTLAAPQPVFRALWVAGVIVVAGMHRSGTSALAELS